VDLLASLNESCTQETTTWDGLIHAQKLYSVKSERNCDRRRRRGGVWFGTTTFELIFCCPVTVRVGDFSEIFGER
jgi:hypothetical protein